MGRRGHMFGMISIVSTSWLFKADGKGLLKISDGIRWDAEGDDSHISLTEVCSCTLPRYGGLLNPVIQASAW